MALRLRSYFLSLAAAVLCVLCLGSHTAYAQIDDTDFADGEISTGYITYYYDPSSESSSTIGTTGVLNFSGGLGYLKHSNFSYATGKSDHFRDYIYIENKTEPLFHQGNSVYLTIDNLVNTVVLTSSSGGTITKPLQAINDYNVFVYDIYGNSVMLNDATVEINTGSTGTYGQFSIVLNTGILDFDVYKVVVNLFYGDMWSAYGHSNSQYINGGYGAATYTYKRIFGYENATVGWTIYPKSTALVESIKESVSDIADSIVNLPGNIWSTFETGLTNLFVPDDQAISDMQEDWNNLLADRFGALYQVTDLVTDFADAFKESEQKTVTLPEITIPVGGDGWTFGGWEVQVVPDGMGVLFTTLKTLVSIVATFLFVNGLKKRFEGLIGGAPTA